MFKTREKQKIKSWSKNRNTCILSASMAGEAMGEKTLFPKPPQEQWEEECLKSQTFSPQTHNNT